MWEKTLDRLRDRHLIAILVAVTIVTRLPFVKTVELVAYDGTYYLNQARALLAGRIEGAFPIGYPVLVAIFHLVVRDIQLAGELVSFVASVGTAVVVFLLAKRFVPRHLALLAALAVTLNPLFVRSSLSALSESVFVFWLVLGLLFYVRANDLGFGLSMGAAAATRPEGLAVFGLLVLSRIRKPRRFAVIASSFLAVYALNIAALSVNHGRLVIVPKLASIGSSTKDWAELEETVDFEDADQYHEYLKSQRSGRGLLAEYAHRFPEDLSGLVRHVLPAIFVLAIVAVGSRRYLFLGAALVPFLTLPIATLRTFDRFFLPYVVVLSVLAVFAVPDIRKRTSRLAVVGLIIATIIALPIVNWGTLTTPEEPGVQSLKTAALEFRNQVEPGDKIASRKPYFAFYTVGEYVGIPLGPYENVIEYLVRERVKYLAMHYNAIHGLRPALLPLFEDRNVINGELRFAQVDVSDSGVMVYARVRDKDPLEATQLTESVEYHIMPTWSPQGRWLAFRSIRNEQYGGIYVIDMEELDETGGKMPTPRLLLETTGVHDELSWSPDGTRIAFAEVDEGDVDILAVDVVSGEVTTLVSNAGRDTSPSWSTSVEELFHTSDRTGRLEVWLTNVTTGESRQVSKDGGQAPAAGPDGESVAWIHPKEGLHIYNTRSGRGTIVPVPKSLLYEPAWSPDGRYLAVTATDWGSWDIYLVKADGTDALLLTKNQKVDVIPAWSPDGRTIAIASDRGAETFNLWLLGGLQPFLDRLDAQLLIRTIVGSDEAPRG